MNKNFVGPMPLKRYTIRLQMSGECYWYNTACDYCNGEGRYPSPDNDGWEHLFSPVYEKCIACSGRGFKVQSCTMPDELENLMRKTWDNWWLQSGLIDLILPEYRPKPGQMELF